jgi:hypothetical protein
MTLGNSVGTYIEMKTVFRCGWGAGNGACVDKGMPLSEVDGELDECGGVMARHSDTERSELCWRQGSGMRV